SWACGPVWRPRSCPRSYPVATRPGVVLRRVSGDRAEPAGWAMRIRRRSSPIYARIHHMCGLLAFLSSRGYAGLKQDGVAKALESLHHRGPDETGIRVVDEDVVFGHKRLAVLDVAGSHEPLFYADGRYVIVFNGEIYNYVELRDELIRDHGA